MLAVLNHILVVVQGDQPKTQLLAQSLGPKIVESADEHEKTMTQLFERSVRSSIALPTGSRLDYGYSLWEFEVYAKAAAPNNSAPTILTEPTNQSSTIGSTATFTVTAGGTAHTSRSARRSTSR
jgi:hypothetical protein